MRTFLLAAALALLPFSAKSQDNPPTPQASCPLMFTSGDYHPHQPLPVPDPNATTADKTFGTLEFGYKNATDKAIRAFHVTAHFAPPGGVRPPLLKRLPRDTQHFVQSDPLAANDASHASYEIQSEVGALLWLRLDRVEFQDGSLWKLPKDPATSNTCAFYPKAALVPAQDQ